MGGNRKGQCQEEQTAEMEGAETGDRNNPLLAEGERFRRNARAFLIAVARFAEACEAREARRARNNPWATGQVQQN